ncbi:hypothetical protein EIP86_006952 [Pleurotus ostreatoroseus]|nr:hypothetical protein EIP86_006952 [Pleurotus ostreatoroseus]
MLAARASAARSAFRIARNFATVVDTAGVKVAAADNGEAASSVTLLVKAGSRFQNKPGVAHALQNFAFRSTAKRSALGTIRESELYGGVLSSNLSREYLALTTEFLRGDESYFVDVLSSFVIDAKFTRHELAEYVAPVCEAESLAAAANPETRAIELAHALAFRSGLGASLFSSANDHVDAEAVRAFASAAFTKDSVAVLGTGISQETLTRLLEPAFSKLPASTGVAATSSAYFGGETRIEAHGGPQTVFVGFGVPGAPSPALSVLAAHLSSAPSIKWSEAASPVPVNAKAVLFSYSDAALFGFLVTGETAEEVKTAGKAAVAALKAGVKAEDVKRAVAKAKFAAASAADGRTGLVSSFGAKILAGAPASVGSTISALEQVDASALSNVTSTLLKSKPTFVAVGETSALPHADELGL